MGTDKLSPQSCRSDYEIMPGLDDTLKTCYLSRPGCEESRAKVKNINTWPCSSSRALEDTLDSFMDVHISSVLATRMAPCWVIRHAPCQSLLDSPKSDRLMEFQLGIAISSLPECTDLKKDHCWTQFAEWREGHGFQKSTLHCGHHGRASLLEREGINKKTVLTGQQGNHVLLLSHEAANLAAEQGKVCPTPMTHSDPSVCLLAKPCTWQIVQRGILRSTIPITVLVCKLHNHVDWALHVASSLLIVAFILCRTSNWRHIVPESF